MEIAENLIKTTMEEIEKVLSTKSVVGEPMTIEGKTLIPLVSIGFGFGAGGGSGKGGGKEKTEGEGAGGGAGGGAGVKPVAIVIIDKESVRVEPIKGGFTNALEKIVEKIPEIRTKQKEGQK